MRYMCRIKWYLIFNCIIHLVSSDSIYIACRNNTDQESRVCYQIVTNKTKTFDDSDAECKKMGGKLASIQNKQEQVFIEGVIRGLNSHNISFWTGGYKRKDSTGSRTWTWVDDSSFDFEHFIGGEPNGPDKEFCISMHHPYGYRWNDRDCVEKLGYICKSSNNNNVRVYENNTVTLICDTESGGVPTSLTWNRTVNGTSVIVSQYAKGGNLTSPNLTFNHIKWSDEGNYTCHVRYPHGHSTIICFSLRVTTTTSMCPCNCIYRRKLEHLASKILQDFTNMTNEELQKILEPTLERIRQDMSVNKSSLSSYKRKRQSASDTRKSSGVMGTFAITFIVVVVGLVILMDIIWIKQHLNAIGVLGTEMGVSAERKRKKKRKI